MESTDSSIPKGRIRADKLILGVVLLVVGVAGFLGTIDVLDLRDIWRLWPLFLIIIGVGSEAEAIRNRRRGGGWVLIAIGTWFLIENYHLFGLRHGRAFPVVIVIAGAAIALHALLDRPASALAAKEISHDRTERNDLNA